MLRNVSRIDKRDGKMIQKIGQSEVKVPVFI